MVMEAEALVQAALATAVNSASSKCFRDTRRNDASIEELFGSNENISFSLSLDSKNISDQHVNNLQPSGMEKIELNDFLLAKDECSEAPKFLPPMIPSQNPGALELPFPSCARHETEAALCHLASAPTKMPVAVARPVYSWCVSIPCFFYAKPPLGNVVFESSCRLQVQSNNAQ